MSSTRNILVIYARPDKDVLQHLLLHLKPLEKDFNITIWSEDAVKGGQRWEPRSIPRLDHADIFLLLLSHSFSYSEFIKQDEFKMVIDRYKKGKAIVIPILLDDCPWDVEFAFDDYNFNFRELLVFQKDETRVEDWNPTDKVFTQVAYYVRGLLTSSTQKSALEEPANGGDKKIPNTKKGEQIALDFFEEREVDNKVESDVKGNKEAEAKKRVEENNKLSEEAEAKEIIRKEKRLRQKAEIQKRIQKEVDARREVQKYGRGDEDAEAKMAVEEKRRGEITNSQNGTEREKELGKIVTTKGRVAKKNDLARYNYQFKTSKEVAAKRVVHEERSGNEEAKARIAVARKRRGEITTSRRETEGEKRLGQIIEARKKITKKYGLAKYNYQFETAGVVEAKRVVQEQGRGDKETKAKVVGEEKRPGKIVPALKRVLKRNRFALKNHQVHNTVAVKQFLKGVKAKAEVEQKRLGEIVEALKRVMKKNLLVVQQYQVKGTTAINQLFKEAKKNISKNKKGRVRSEFLIAALVMVGILFYVFTGDSEKQSTTLSEVEEAGGNSDAGVNTKMNTENQAAAILELGIGDVYKDGIIFAIDPSNKTGKIAYMDDKGPMTWNNAMTIHEQLGAGWRLPTLDELRLMYKNIGQGADNKGEFADELYWSATPFDDYQARLLRFSDGNASYHFNSSGTFREFRVRAIKDFGL